jgi:hypothetical protein
MNVKFSVLLFSFLCLSSCQDDTKQRIVQQEKENQKREIVFANINKGWNFNAQPLNETSRALLTNWSEWRIFLKELSQKPKSSIGAFQLKAKTLSLKANDLNNHIPFAYDKPEIKSRIAALATQVNSVNLYIHLDNIPDKKIVQLVQEINIELASMQRQLEEIDRKSKIKTEAGEAEMIRMLDTTRAIPTSNDPKLKPYK